MYRLITQFFFDGSSPKFGKELRGEKTHIYNQSINLLTEKKRQRNSEGHSENYQIYFELYSLRVNNLALWNATKLSAAKRSYFSKAVFN